MGPSFVSSGAFSLACCYSQAERAARRLLSEVEWMISRFSVIAKKRGMDSIKIPFENFGRPCRRFFIFFFLRETSDFFSFFSRFLFPSLFKIKKKVKIKFWF